MKNFSIQACYRDMFQSACEADGGYLVEIEDEEENMFVKSLISEGMVYPGTEIIKNIFMLNSAEHVIYPAHKMLNANKLLAF